MATLYDYLNEMDSAHKAYRQALERLAEAQEDANTATDRIRTAETKLAYAMKKKSLQVWAMDGGPVFIRDGDTVKVYERQRTSMFCEIPDEAMELANDTAAILNQPTNGKGAADLAADLSTETPDKAA